jgi:hypothetical protein
VRKRALDEPRSVERLWAGAAALGRVIMARKLPATRAAYGPALKHDGGAMICPKVAALSR